MKLGYAGIYEDGKWGVLGIDGKIIVEPIYTMEFKSIQPYFLGKYYKVYYGIGELYYTDEIIE